MLSHVDKRVKWEMAESVLTNFRHHYKNDDKLTDVVNCNRLYLIHSLERFYSVISKSFVFLVGLIFNFVHNILHQVHEASIIANENSNGKYVLYKPLTLESITLLFIFFIRGGVENLTKKICDLSSKNKAGIQCIHTSSFLLLQSLL